MTAELDSAMRRQLRRRHAARLAGMPRVGLKICVNDPTAQARLGLAAPFVGWLNGARLIGSGAAYPVPSGGRFVCEPEIAIRIGQPHDLVSLVGARAAIAALAPALEVVDYRRLSPELAVIVETSSFHDGAVLGASRSPGSMPALGPDCPRLLRNGEPAGTVDPALVPADLAAIVLHVAAFLCRLGEDLREGDWILSGACASPIPMSPGDDLSADFGPSGWCASRCAETGMSEARGFALPGGDL